MKRLILLRHAKSDWSGPNEPDHDRPLNLRGRLAAPLMGAWIAELAAEGGWGVDAVLSSTSLRTRETWERLAPLIDRPPAPIFDNEIYLADPETMLEALRKAPETATTVLMLGHNPGIETFAMRLAARGGPKPGRFPTAAAAIFEAADSGQVARWADADFGVFQLIAFETPKTLVCPPTPLLSPQHLDLKRK